jgi:hypothetical protein
LRFLSLHSSATASLVLVATPAMYNAQDVSGGIQAAIKNLASNNVFYFNIPISLEVVFAAGPGMEVAALAAAWKSIEDSQEASQLVNGKFSHPYFPLLALARMP